MFRRAASIAGGKRGRVPALSAHGVRLDYALFLAAPAVLGALLVLAREVTYGAGLGPDSLRYVSTAQNLLEGRGMVEAKEAPYTLWPPLYPLLLAAVSGLCGLDPLDVGGPLNAVFFGLLVFFAGRYLRRRLKSRFLAAWAAVSLAVSIPLIDAAAWIMTEPLFMLTATLALIQADAFLSESKPRFPAWAAAWSAAAWLTRYIGVAVPAFVGLLLLCRPGWGYRRKARNAAVFAVATGLPMALWMLRNFLLEGVFSGVRWEYDYPLPAVMRDFAGMLRAWAHFEIPPIGPLQPPTLFSLEGAAALAVAAGAAGYVLFRFQWKKQSLADWRPFAIFTGYALLYSILMIAASVLEYSDAVMRLRYVLPVYTPLLFAAAFALDRFLDRERERRPAAGRPSWAAAVGAAALCLWTAGHVAPHVRLIGRAVTTGKLGRMSHTGPGWADSEMLQYIREHPLDGVVYVSGPRMVPALHNRGFASYYNLHNAWEFEAMHGNVPHSPAAWQKVVEWKLNDAPDGAWLIFNHNEGKNNWYGYGTAYMRTFPGLNLVAELADADIYKLEKDAQPPANPYRQAYEQAVSGRLGEPDAHSGFDVWRKAGELIYIKEPCSIEDMRKRFFLHVYPLNATGRRGRAAPIFDNLDFFFSQHGVVMDEACAVVRPLPDYAAARIETGQYVSGESVTWAASWRPPAGE